MGRKWYEDGKLLHKKNSIYDFVDVARFLADTYTSPNGGMLSCEGASAGGLLVGASINEDPELFRVAILGHPFVDVAVTMTDASLPLTSGEWIEWGCPNEEVFFEYMLSYSPNNNIKAGVQYPAMWITVRSSDFLECTRYELSNLLNLGHPLHYNVVTEGRSPRSKSRVLGTYQAGRHTSS